MNLEDEKLHLQVNRMVILSRKKCIVPSMYITAVFDISEHET